MTTATMNANGRTQRKNLSEQIDRLDTILDGLAEALNESVADAVRDVVGQVVKESVEASIRQVLSSPDLLKAALARHEPMNTQPVATPAPRRTLKEVLRDALGKLCQTGGKACGKASKGLGLAWSCCLNKVRQRCAGMGQVCRSTLARCTRALTTTRTVVNRLWHFRKTCVVAMGVGAIVGMGSYLAGPLTASVLSAVSGAGLTVASLILLPLARLMLGSNTGA